METRERLTFEIEGNDLDNLRKFCKQHKDCPRGMTGEQFEYCFVPTGIGLAVSVKCSCGQVLRLGNFMDYSSGEYDELTNRYLTEEDRRNGTFEEAVRRVLTLKNPRLFRLSFGRERNFETIYAFAVGAALADERIAESIHYRCERDQNGSIVDNYEGLDEKAKIAAFYDFFEKQITEKLEQYNCQNDELLRLLHQARSWG